MNEIQNLNSEEQGNLHIVENMDVNNLPELMKNVLSLANTPAEKDMLLMSALVACGSVMPNLYVKYGIGSKRYYPNLQLFIVGSAACGKGIANLALELVKPIHEKMPLIIPGDATYPAFYQTLARQKGRGYIHESEGSVITDIWRSSTANYNTALRKAAEHETISRARCKAASVIENPQLSMVLTGTFGQYHALVPSIENGYFSRLLTLIIDEHQAFDSRYVEPSKTSGEVMKAAAEQLYLLYEKLLFTKPREFKLTADQKSRLGNHLQTAYPTLIRMLGEDFHSVVLRMAVHIERIAMILSALRLSSVTSESDSDTSSLSSARGVRPENIVCADEDYAIAELIGNKLILHMAQAYQLIKGTEKVSLPAVKPLDQKQILLSLLPAEFGHAVLLKEAATLGIPARTAERWNEGWQQTGIVFRLKHDCYKKIA
ncbi:MAG: DUF3987 domain-containing protein [Paludibacteraceae bacterium]|nr:DUF3987 domain-containing protein [Paludibacteraceae bacterium]